MCIGRCKRTIMWNGGNCSKWIILLDRWCPKTPMTWKKGNLKFWNQESTEGTNLEVGKEWTNKVGHTTTWSNIQITHFQSTASNSWRGQTLSLLHPSHKLKRVCSCQGIPAQTPVFSIAFNTGIFGSVRIYIFQTSLDTCTSPLLKFCTLPAYPFRLTTDFSDISQGVRKMSDTNCQSKHECRIVKKTLGGHESYCAPYKMIPIPSTMKPFLPRPSRENLIKMVSS